MEQKYELIFTILNRGFSDLAMDSARAEGATGGTILTARGAGAKEVERLFGLTLSQEKEIILILATKENRSGIMTAICKSAGLNTQGKGIAFSVPVDDVCGIALGLNPKSGLSEKTADDNEKAKEEKNE
jgi:nitrogen regulatory protein PII